MGNDEQYHRVREQQCRAMAAQSRDAAIRQRHEQLAELHARELQAKRPATDEVSA